MTTSTRPAPFNTRLVLVIAIHAALPLQALGEGGLHTPKGGLAMP